MADYKLDITLDELNAMRGEGVGLRANLGESPVSADSPLSKALRYGEQLLGGGVDATASVYGLAEDLNRAISPSVPSEFKFDMVNSQRAGETSRALQEGVGIKQPQGLDERFARNLGTFGTDLLIPGPGGAERKVASSLLGALGLTTAEELMPDSPAAATAGAVIGSSIPDLVEGTAKTVARVARRGAPTAKELDRSIGGLIQDTGLTEERLARAADQKVSDIATGNPYAPYKSTAEMTKNPKMAALEVNARTMAPGDFAMEQIGRDRTRVAQLDRTIPGKPKSAEEFGESLRGVTEDAFFKEQERMTDLYKGIDPEGKSAIPTKPIRNEIREVLRERGMKDARRIPLPSRARAEVQAFLTDNTDVNFRDTAKNLDEMMGFRSRAHELANDLTAKGETYAAGTMRKVAKIYDDAIERAAKDGAGLTEAQAKAWREANKQYSRFMDTYEKGMVKSTVRGSRVEADRIADRLLNASPATVRKLKKAIKTGSEDADSLLKEYRRQVLLRLSEQAKDATGEVTLGGIRRALRLQSRKGMLKELFEPAQLRRIERLQRDLLSQERVTRIGRKASQGQSYTTQGLLTAESIASKVLDGSLDNIPVVGRYMRLLRGNVDETALRVDIGKKLLRAAMDPEYAKVLVQAANNTLPPKMLERILTEAFGAYAVTSPSAQGPSETPPM